MEAINQSKQLLVEGIDDSEFFKALLKHLTISDIQVQNIQGKDKLRQFLTLLVSATNFESVQSVGVIRDADQDASAAFDSVCSALKLVDLNRPRQVGTISTGQPRTGIYILPGLDANSGMLEDLCLNMLETEAAIVCIDEYFQCLSSEGIQPPRNFAKAKITAFLASRHELKQRVGYAMNQDYWNWEHPCLSPLKEFLKAL